VLERKEKTQHFIYDVTHFISKQLPRSLQKYLPEKNTNENDWNLRMKQKQSFKQMSTFSINKSITQEMPMNPKFSFSSNLYVCALLCYCFVHINKSSEKSSPFIFRKILIHKHENLHKNKAIYIKLN
jgi:hypothetical protein